MSMKTCRRCGLISTQVVHSPVGCVNALKRRLKLAENAAAAAAARLLDANGRERLATARLADAETRIRKMADGVASGVQRIEEKLDAMRETKGKQR